MTVRVLSFKQRNIGSQRLERYHIYNKQAISQDPIVIKHNEEMKKKSSSALEVTSQVISSMTRDKVSKKGKKQVSDFLRMSPSPVQVDEVEVKEPQVYTFKNNKRIVANRIGMKVILYDKSFARDQL